MTAYQLDKLIEQTRRLAADFREQCGQTLPVSTELAHYDAAKILNLIRDESSDSGVDFIGHTSFIGEKIQVKSRVIFDNQRSGLRVGKINFDSAWDRIILVIYNSAYHPTEIYSLSRDEILKSHDMNHARPISVAKFRAIGEMLWSHQSV